MLAGQSIFCAFGQWSQLAKQCSRADFRSPLAPPPALRMWTWVPILSVVMFWWQRWVGEGVGGGGHGIPMNACTEFICTSTSVRPSAQPPLTAQLAPHNVRQASISTMVCGGGGRVPALAGEGGVKGLRAFASTQTAGNEPWLHLRGGARPFPYSLPPQIPSTQCLALAVSGSSPAWQQHWRKHCMAFFVKEKLAGTGRLPRIRVAVAI